MTISESTLRATRYWPERLPNSGVVSLLGGVVCAPQLAIQQFGKAGLWVRMGYITQPLNANINMRLTSDSIINTIPLAAIRNGIAETQDLESLNYLDFTYVSAIPVLNHTWYHDLWVYKPTIAHKIARGQTLDAEEEALAQELGLYGSVVKGVLPLPLPYQIEREYRVIHEQSRTRTTSLVAGVTTVLDSIYNYRGEAIILTGFSCTPGIVGDITLFVGRDKDVNLVDGLWTFPMTFNNDNPVYIPAIHDMTLYARSAGGIGAGGFNIRYTIRRVKLTDILMARWGLASADELGGDVWKKVRGGIL